MRVLVDSAGRAQGRGGGGPGASRPPSRPLRGHRGPARRRGNPARAGAPRPGAPGDDRRAPRGGLRARDDRRAPGGSARYGGSLTESQRPPEAKTSRAPGSRATTLASGGRTLTTHTRPASQAFASRAASQNTSRASGRRPPKASTLFCPSTITARRPEYHSSAPEFSSGPSWTIRSSRPARRTSSRPTPSAARWPETRPSAPAINGRSASIGASTTNAATFGRAHAPPPTRTQAPDAMAPRSEEHTSELQSQFHLVCRLLLEKKKKQS